MQPRVCGAAIVLAGALSGTAVHAEPPARPATRVYEADSVIVTATRREQTARLAPASVSVISRASIEAQAPSTFDQLLEGVPGIDAFRSAGVSVQSMSIRGSSDVAGGGVGNRVLLLVDGRPALTSDAGGAFWSLVPSQIIERVEVVKGAYSSLYGSTAMGGVVNVITRRPGDAPGGRFETKVGFFEPAPAAIRYTSSLPVQSEVTADYATKLGAANLLLGASRKQSDGHAEATGYEVYDGFAKLSYSPKATERWDVTLSGGAADNDYPHTWLNSADPLRVRSSYADDRQEKRYGSIDLAHTGFHGVHFKHQWHGYYYRHEQRSFFNENDPSGEIPGNEPFGSTTTIDGDKIGSLVQLDAFVGPHRVVAGVDLQIDHVSSAPDTIVYGDHQINNAAVFVQEEWKLSPAVVATAGARYDSNHLVSGKTFGELSPKLGLVWSPRSDLALRALFARAFRAPTIAELFFQRELGGGVDFVPNPALRAEELDRAFEVGVRFTPNDRLELDAAVYHYDYDDMIYWVSVAEEEGVDYPLFQVRNLNRAVMQGVELTAAATVHRNVRASGSYTFLDAEDRSSGRTDDVLAYRPKHSAGAAVDLAWTRWKLRLDARYRSRVEEVFLYPLQAPEAFVVANANLRLALDRRVELSLRVGNLFDASYEELARYRMPGRSWLFGVSITR